MKLTDKQHRFLDDLLMGRRLRLATREEDRVRQSCRKAGFAEVLQNPRRWALTEAGRAALSAKESSHD